MNLRKQQQQAQRNQQAQQPKQPAPVALYGSDIHPAITTINGQDIQLGAFVAQAHADSGLTAEAWNQLPGAERDRLIDAVVVAAGGPSSLPPATPLQGQPPEGQDGALAKAGEGVQNPPEGQPEAPAVPMVRMKAPHAGARCNLHNVAYEADEHGHVHVPAHAADHLIPHGYSRA